ncbi:unnamed protein product [Acanthoscelides obtectus]|uniref:Uncharacterized protein n=1 Tax=Acanthoscelides obtectus TaxID=200917 RepID=A0A9P0MCA4_ACAOB|nr:unnamed protein product [Acanthoscelides obtectus]CAK1667980.1 hypothetical protein AOBTE_LOCUS26158 [Acanthoscelides obtectus]
MFRLYRFRNVLVRVCHLLHCKTPQNN